MGSYFVYMDIETDSPVVTVATNGTSTGMGVLIDAFEDDINDDEALVRIAEERNKVLLESFACPRCRREAKI